MQQKDLIKKIEDNVEGANIIKKFIPFLEEELSIPMAPLKGEGVALNVFFEGRCFGASIIRNNFSYGAEEGLFEIVVIEGDNDVWELVYDTPITEDVMGYCDAEEVVDVLNDIKELTLKEVVEYQGLR